VNTSASYETLTGSYTIQRGFRLVELGGTLMWVDNMIISQIDTCRSQISEEDSLRLRFLCAKLIYLCAKVTEDVDPTAAAMLAYVAEEVAPPEVKAYLQ
jgi:hypothetical protein